MTSQSMLAPDAAMVLGIAATALPFARTPEEQSERWLRVLRLHGEVGAALQALGVSEIPLPTTDSNGGHPQHAPIPNDDRDVIALVTDQAVRIADRRGAAGVGTTDILIAVMHVYGEDFERVLRAHGTDPYEVLEQLGSGAREPGQH